MADEVTSSDGSEGWSEFEVTEDDMSAAALSQCLFCHDMSGDGSAILSHLTIAHGVDVVRMCHDRPHTECFDFYKYVNYIRSKKIAADEAEAIWRNEPWGDESYLKPVDPEDALLQFDIEAAMERYDARLPNQSKESEGNRSDTDPCPSADSAAFSNLSKSYPDPSKGHVLPPESASVNSDSDLVRRPPTEQFKAMSLALVQASEDMDTMRSRVQALLLADSASGDNSGTGAVGGLTVSEDEGYVSSYSHYGIHLEMLQDKVRTEGYMRAILDNPEVFHDKVVLDVGCGTGILSMFAAKAGAKHVVGVDMSDVIYQAMDIVRENGLDDKVTLIKGKMEEVVLPFEKVDIIISEWMGYFLLFESMLDSVIFARDKYLAHDGFVLPNRCTMVIHAQHDLALYSRHVTYWENVYGFKMSCMQGEVTREGLVRTVPSDTLISQPTIIQDIDCCRTSVKKLNFSHNFYLTLTQEGPITALVGSFDAFFDHLSLTSKSSFSTGPDSTTTHWKQTVFFLKEPMECRKGEVLACKILCMKNPKDPRSLILELTVGAVRQRYLIQ